MRTCAQLDWRLHWLLNSWRYSFQGCSCLLPRLSHWLSWSLARVSPLALSKILIFGSSCFPVSALGFLMIPKCHTFSLASPCPQLNPFLDCTIASIGHEIVPSWPALSLQFCNFQSFFEKMKLEKRLLEWKCVARYLDSQKLYFDRRQVLISHWNINVDSCGCWAKRDLLHQTHSSLMAEAPC